MNLIEVEVMPVTLSIKNVPDDLAAGLRVRAARNHRSLQGELIVILEQTVSHNSRLTARELLNQVRSYGVTTRDEAVAMIRADRDFR